MLEIMTMKTSQFATFSCKKQYEVIVVMPSIDMALAHKAASIMLQRTQQTGLLIIAEDDQRLGFIMTSNLIYAKTHSDFFVYTAQDAFPAQSWLETGIQTMLKTDAGLLAFNDGRFFGKIAVFGLVRRAWVATIYKKFVFYPEYKSHFADTELSVIACQKDSLVFNPNAILLEVDYEKHLHPNNPDDDVLYRKRCQTGFDGRVTPFIAV